MSNRDKGRPRTDKSRAQVIMYAFFGKAVMWAIIFVVFAIIINSIFGDYLTNLAWLFNIDPTMLWLLMGITAFLFTVIFMRTVSGGRRRSSK